MSSDNPESWTLPARWAPLREGEWEFEHLQRFAVALVAHDPSFTVRLDAFEDGYLKIDISTNASKVGEVFVNRAPGDQDRAAYRLFLGPDRDEKNAQSIEVGITCVLEATGVWRDHPGAED